MGIENVKTIVAVLSGKGGVGKSSVSVQLAQGFAADGLKVGILDLDICGPSIPRMLGQEGENLHESEEGLVPVMLGEGLSLVSVGFLAEAEEAIIWRGPKKKAIVSQLINDVLWGSLDVLVIDTPPGTSDEHIGLVSTLKELGRRDSVRAILVTTPQMASLQDVTREINFCKKTELPMSGIIENMSGFVCPHCSECTNIFNKGNAAKLAEKYETKVLGTIPIDPNFGSTLDEGRDFMKAFENSATASSIKSIVQEIRSTL